MGRSQTPNTPDREPVRATGKVGEKQAASTVYEVSSWLPSLDENPAGNTENTYCETDK